MEERRFCAPSGCDCCSAASSLCVNMRDGERRLAAFVVDASRRPRLSGGRVFCVPLPKPANALRMSSGFWTFFMLMLISMAVAGLRKSKLRTERNQKEPKPKRIKLDKTKQEKYAGCQLPSQCQRTDLTVHSMLQLQCYNFNTASMYVTISVSTGIKSV